VIPAATAAFGEIGLTGRLRPAAQADRRLEECAKLGLGVAIVPSATMERQGLEAKPVDTVRQAIEAALAGDAGKEPGR
jgi:DNA repair protein RadA/Sms